MSAVHNRCLQLIGALAILGLSLTSCQSGSERIGRVVAALPAPSTATLLARQDGIDQGSEDACTFLYTKLLYGTDNSYDRIRDFYVDALVSKSWRRWSDEFLPPGDFAWRKDKAYRLSLSSQPDLDFSEDIVTKARNDYETVYFLVVSYADRLARTKCLGETE